MPVSERPNILFICSDQHQARASGFAGHPDALTPNLDRLAAQSIRFDAAYCQSPVCVPSRGSIVTGLYPHRHGALTLDDALPEDVPTIAHRFRDHGYATAAIGKMHFKDESLRHGFDHRVNEADFRRTLTDAEWQTLRDDQGGGGGVNGRPSDLDARFFQDTFFADRTVAFLESVIRPFCLWSSFFMPHTPLVPMAEYFNLYDQGSLALAHRPSDALTQGFEGHLIRARERGWYDQSEGNLRRALAGYYGNISQMDACVGRVLDALEANGHADKTIVVYTSDHGEMAGAHRMWTKHVMFEDSVRVPLLVRLPDNSHAGTSRDRLVEQVDLYPTLCELSGLPLPEDIDGRSFGRLIDDPEADHRDAVYSVYHFCRNVFTRDDRYVGKNPIRMLRTERWKLNALEWGRSELYDLENDPNETTNRIDDPALAGVVEDMRRRLHRVFE